MREAEVGPAPTILPDELLDEWERTGPDVLRHAIRRVRAEAGAPAVARFNNQNGGVPTVPHAAGRGDPTAGPDEHRR
ncbi:hypothetical protein [Micromonospora sp. NPDC002575]|uniref:hypothetical protein n=1 Tax=Micromonospora sp. NPDC002575 TaxID=3364222 RepID=UPI0036AEAC40